MLKSFLSAAFALLSFSAFAQFTVSGTVRGGERALSGATVQLMNSNRFAVSDNFGRFRIEKLSAGEHTLVIKYLGYEDHLENVTLAGHVDLDISLEEATTMTDEVVVESTRATTETPTTFTNVDRQAIERQNFGQDLPYLLNWTPSLVTTSDAGTGVGYTGLRIRGSDASRINVTINGIPYNDSESLGTFWVDVPDIASSSQSIQIQRGVGTSTNGGGAFGGTVNVQTNALRDEPYAEITSSVGSFNTQRYTFRGGTGLMSNHWSFDGRVSKIKSDGYVDRASSDLDSYYLSGGYYGEKSIWKAIAFGGHEVTYQSWYGLDPDMLKTNRQFNYAGAIYDENWNVVRYYDSQVDNYRQDHAQLHFSHAVSPQLTTNVALHYTYGRGFYEEYAQGVPFASMGLSDITLKDTTLTQSDFVTRKWLNNHFYGATFSVNYSTDRFDLVTGGGYHRYAPAKHYGQIIWATYAPNAPLRHRYYEGESDKSDFNVYSKLSYRFTDRINGFIDLQYRNVTYTTDGTDDDQTVYAIDDAFNFFNPKAGLVYTASGNDQVYLSYAVAHREPVRSDYLNGETKPKAERLGNLEAGWRRQTPQYHLELNYYLMNYKDQLVFTGELNNVGSPIRANVGKSYRTGVELAGLVNVAARITWQLNATWSANKNIDYVWVDGDDNITRSDTDIILSPEWILGSQLVWNAFTGFNASLLTKYVGEQYLDNTENENLALDGYLINDLRLAYRFFPKGTKGVELGLLVNNLFDVAYASNGYSYGDVPYVYPQAGTNVLAMVNLKF